MTALLASVLDVLQLAHETQLPHQEPVSSGGSGGGASTIVIIAGIVATLALVGGLVWVKKRVDG